MKKIQFLSVILILFAAFNGSSCSEVEPIDPAIIIDPNPNPNPTSGLFKVDFDGQTFSTSTTLVYLSGGSIIINAMRPQGDTFGVILSGNTTGTYPANDNLIAYSPAGSEYGYTGNHPTDEIINTGSMVVTSINTTNKTISGTFQFTGYWSNYDVTLAPKVFTNGVFTNLPYVTQNPTGDTFSAQINGVEFVDTDILTVETDIAGQQNLSVGASNSNDDSITVTVRSNLGTGNYTITGNVATDLVQIKYVPSSSTSGAIATSGSVTITQKTATRIKGTFNGLVTIATVPYQITVGTFDVEY